MRKNNCEVIRRELDELMLDEACSASVMEHLKGCSACCEFHQTQTKLRQMVGSLCTVAAPADFDFRLRARLAVDAGSESFHYWSLARKGLAFGTVLLAFATGLVVIRNLTNQPARYEVAADRTSPVQPETTKPAETTETKANDLTMQVQESSARKNKFERLAPGVSKNKRPLRAIDFASQRAEVISGTEAVDSGATAIIPIDASLQSLKVSLDDGSGNARTISLPTIRFGSQRMLPNGNQFAQKGIW